MFLVFLCAVIGGRRRTCFSEFREPKFERPLLENLKSKGVNTRLKVSVGQFYWGGSLLKSNGGVQRFFQFRWKLDVECKDIKKLDCETYKSSKDESRS